MKKVQWGILGTAGIAQKSTIPGMLQAKNCGLYAIAGRDKDKVDAFQQSFHIPKGYVGYDALLEDPQVEAVYIPLSNQLHKEWCIKAARKGKHIFCEKPLAPTEKDLLEIFRVCEENKVKIMEAFPYVHGPVLGRVKEIIASGEIGSVRNLSASFFTARHLITNIRMRRETFGGSIYDLGCYNTSLALEIYGVLPKLVHACGTLTEERIDDYASIVMDFGGNRRAVSNCGMVLTPGNRRMHYAVYGEKGFIEVLDLGYNISGEIPISVSNGQDRRTEIVLSSDNYMLEMEQFGRCVTENEPYRFSHEASIWNARIIDSALLEIGY